MAHPHHVLALSFVALSLTPAAPAWADCGPPAFGFAVCTGTDADGFDAEAEPEGLVLEIRPDAVVSAPGDAIALGDGARVLNAGAIDGGEDAVTGEIDLSVENAGTIGAADDAIDADDSDGLSVVNTGLVTAEDKAITAGDGAGAFLDNAGSIEAGDEGFEAGDDATVLNGAGGTIVAVEDAVQVGRGAFVSNDGTIGSTGPEGDGIDIDDGTILNEGTIRAAGAAGIDFDGEGPDGGLVGEAVVDNGGLIEGAVGIQVETGSAEDAANTAAQSVFNEGTIRGTSGLAIDLGAGDDLVVAVLGARSTATRCWARATTRCSSTATRARWSARRSGSSTRAPASTRSSSTTSPSAASAAAPCPAASRSC